MKKNASFNITAVAHLARLTLTPDDEKRLPGQMAETLSSVDVLNEMPTNDLSPTSQVTGLTNITREDMVEPSLSPEEALANAARTHNGFFVVPYVFE